MDVVERVARAICKGCGLHPDAISPKAAKSGHSIPEWMFFMPAARAAIAALFDWMAEPSEAVFAAAYEAASDACEYNNAGIYWRAMLSAMRAEALEE